MTDRSQFFEPSLYWGVNQQQIWPGNSVEFRRHVPFHNLRHCGQVSLSKRCRGV